MKFSKLSAKNKTAVIMLILIFGGYGLYSIVDSIIGLCRPEAGIFIGIIKIIWGLLFIAFSIINTANIFRKLGKSQKQL